MKNKLWAGLFLLFGFTLTDCQKDMYGSPHADFEVKGKVTDEAGTPVEGIRVSVKPAEGGDYPSMSSQTGAAGEYQMSERRWMYLDISLNVIAEDIDGEANGGEFATQIIPIELKKSDFTGGDGDWCNGKAKKTLTLRSKKQLPKILNRNE